MRGRRPQPDAVKSQKVAVRSTRNRRPQADSAPVSTAMQPPAWLKKEGLKVWEKLAPTLRAAKLLTDADAPAFARYCRNTALWLKMRKQMDDEGEHYESESQHGKLKRVHPAFMIADRVERQLLAAEDRFGLNPAERQRIMVARAQTGVTGDLFSADKAGERRPGDPAAEPAQPAKPIESPVGFLN
jgi:P27 family predicted phage terminase small subunit